MEYLEYVKGIAVLIILIVGYTLTLIKSGNTNKSISQIKELIMKYQTIEDKVNNLKGQTFASEKTQYIYNNTTKELEELPNKLDLQAMINEGMTTALDTILNRFTEPHVESDEVADYNQACYDLIAVGEAMEIAENYREQFHLPDTMSVSDIFAFIDNYSKRLKAALGNYSKDNVKQDIVSKADKSEDD